MRVTIDQRRGAVINSPHTMKRKLFILAFVISVASNSMAAVWPYIAGDDDCAGTCCKAVRPGDMSSSADKLCCLTQCEHPAANQGAPEASLLRTERDNRSATLVASGIQAVYSTLCARWGHAPARTLFPSTHIYLRTGTLLI